MGTSQPIAPTIELERCACCGVYKARVYLVGPVEVDVAPHVKCERGVFVPCVDCFRDAVDRVRKGRPTCSYFELTPACKVRRGSAHKDEGMVTLQQAAMLSLARVVHTRGK